MITSLRLDEQLVKQLDAIARRRGIKKSELIRQCLTDFVARETGSTTAWELGKGLFGVIGSGNGKLSQSVEQIVRERTCGGRGRRR